MVIRRTRFLRRLWRAITASAGATLIGGGTAISRLAALLAIHMARSNCPDSHGHSNRAKKKAADTMGLRPQIAVERLIDYARLAIYP